MTSLTVLCEQLSELLSCCYVGFNVVFLACRVQLEAGAQYIAGIKITMNKLDTLFNGTWKTMMSTGRRKSLQGFRLEEPMSVDSLSSC